MYKFKFTGHNIEFRIVIAKNHSPQDEAILFHTPLFFTFFILHHFVHFYNPSWIQNWLSKSLTLSNQHHKPLTHHSGLLKYYTLKSAASKSTHWVVFNFFSVFTKICTFLIHTPSVERPIFGEDFLILLSSLGFCNPSPTLMQNQNTPLSYSTWNHFITSSRICKFNRNRKKEKTPPHHRHRHWLHGHRRLHRPPLPLSVHYQAAVKKRCGPRRLGRWTVDQINGRLVPLMVSSNNYKYTK